MPLTEALLRIVGLGVWAFVGAPTLWEMAHHRDQLGSAHGVVWLLAFGVFGAAFVRATREDGLAVRRLALGVQSAAALTLCAVGMPQFEGALLAVVAAQAPGLFPVPWAAAWLLAQAVPLYVSILPSHRLPGALQATGAYLAFGAFAMGAVYLRQRERAARLELGRLNGELLATRGLLADSTRLAERLRISRDLHDVLGHHLVALNLQLELERDRSGATSAPVSAASSIAHRMLDDVRGVVSTLREGPGADVATALRTLAASIAEPEIRLEMPEALTDLDPERAHAIFRCVQEAVTNAVKHGAASCVTVRLTRTPEGFGLSIEDDGRGAETVQFGNGLRGMHERFNKFGGRLEVSSGTSESGRGFALRVSLPREATP